MIDNIQCKLIGIITFNVDAVQYSLSVHQNESPAWHILVTSNEHIISVNTTIEGAIEFLKSQNIVDGTEISFINSLYQKIINIIGKGDKNCE